MQGPYEPPKHKYCRELVHFGSMLVPHWRGPIWVQESLGRSSRTLSECLFFLGLFVHPTWASSFSVERFCFAFVVPLHSVGLMVSCRGTYPPSLGGVRTVALEIQNSGPLVARLSLACCLLDLGDPTPTFSLPCVMASSWL